MSTARKLTQFIADNGGTMHRLSPSEQFLCSQLDLLEARISELESAHLSDRLDGDDEPLTITKLSLAEAQQTIAHLEALADLLTEQRDEARAQRDEARALLAAWS